MNHFFKILRITRKNISRNMIHNLIMVVFVAAAVFFMNISLASFMYSNYLNEFAKTSGLYDSFMYAGETNKHAYFEYMESTGEDLSEKTREYVADELKKLKADGIIADYSRGLRVGYPAGENTDEIIDFLYIKPVLLEELSMPVAEGEWFGSGSSSRDYRSEGLVPVVIGSHLKSIYRTGDIFADASGDTRYVVTGILERGARFLGMSAGGSGVDLNSVARIADDFVIVGEEPEDRYSSFLIRLPEQNREACEQKVLEKIADVADAFSFRDLADRAREGNSYVTEMQTTLAVLALFICIAGITCGNLLSYARGKKRQAVYFLCGMKPQTGMLCLVLENMVRIYFPMAAGLWIFFYYCRKQEYRDLYPGGYNICVTVVIITFIFAAAVAYQMSITRKNKELDIIHS